MTKDELENKYWRFYLLLEKKFIKIINYVELSEDNYKTYSLEFVSLLREIGSEIDIIMKEFCESSSKKKGNIKKYADEILKDYPNITKQGVIGNGIRIIPFECWDIEKAAQSLEWWKAYNSVKHERINNFNKANLKNVFYSLGALFILNNYLLKKITKEEYYMIHLGENSSIFILERKKSVMEILSENILV